jgi:hypothetical protein
VSPGRTFVALACLWAPWGGSAAETAAADASALAPAPAPADQRVMTSGEWSSLTGGIHGGGGAAAWLGSPWPGVQASVGGDYHALGSANWSYASLAAALTGTGAGPHTTLLAEVHEGSGRDAGRSFDYSIVAAGLSRPVLGGLTLQVEDRQIDVETTHANLPKLTATLLVNPHWLAAVAYAHTVGGNIRSDFVSTRVDYQGPDAGLFAGAAAGHAAPAVVILLGAPGTNSTLHEAFAGGSRSLGRADLLLVFDYMRLGAITRVTVTAACTVHLGHRGP